MPKFVNKKPKTDVEQKIEDEQETTDLAPLFSDLNLDDDQAEKSETPAQAMEVDTPVAATDSSAPAQAPKEEAKTEPKEEPIQYGFCNAEGFKPQPITKLGFTGRYSVDPTEEQVDAQKAQWMKDNVEKRDQYFLKTFGEKIAALSKYETPASKEVNKERKTTGQDGEETTYNYKYERNHQRLKGYREVNELGGSEQSYKRNIPNPKKALNCSGQVKQETF